MTRLVLRAGWKYLHLLPSGLPSEDTRDCSCPCAPRSGGGRNHARAAPSGRGRPRPRHRGPRSIRKCSVKPRRPGVRALRICRGTRSTVRCHAGNGACGSCRTAQHRSGRYHARCDTWISHCDHDARAGRCLQAGQRHSGPGTCDRFHGGCPAVAARRRRHRHPIRGHDTGIPGQRGVAVAHRHGSRVCGRYLRANARDP